jgi:hypothetical protein
MSWIFFLLLAMYGAVRATLWLRGQLRFWKVQAKLPEVPAFHRIPPPRHLTPVLARLHEDVRLLEHVLDVEVRTLATVELVDPDVPLGVVRDFRYRKSVIETRNRLVRWRRHLDGMPIEDLVRLEALGFERATLDGLISGIEAPFRQVTNARALEGFAIDTVRLVRRSYARVRLELNRLEQALQRLDAHPYRPAPLSAAG